MNYEQIVMDNLVLKIRCGSHLFGTNTPESDLDLTGIFMPAPQMVYGFAKCETLKEDVAAKDESGRNTADAVDCTYYEYRFFIKLAMENNPNILHLLFANDENVLLDDPKNFGRDLLNHAHLFPHKGGHHRFVKYADGQRHKMRIKPENYAALQGALEFLKGQDPHAVLGEFRDNRLFVGEPEKGKHLRVGDLYFEPGVYAKKACKMIEERLSKATHRSALFTKYGYDCYSDDTEFLTKAGWKRYDDIGPDDLLGTRNPATGCLEFQPFTERVAKEYAGRLYEQNGWYTKFRVTENHRMFVSPVFRGKNCSSKYVEEKSRWDFWPLHELIDGVKTWFHVLNSVTPSDDEFPVQDDFLRLLGAFISEGSVIRRKGGKVKALRITQTDHGKAAFFEMMEKIRPKFHINRYDYPRHDKGLVETLWDVYNHSADIGRLADCGRTAQEKRLPPWVMDLSGRQCGILLDALFLGDGTQKNTLTRVYYTSSKGLADDVQILAFRAGKEVNIIDGGSAGITDTQMYQVSYRSEVPIPRAMAFNPSMKAFSKREGNREICRGGQWVSYKGRIVCFSVPNETLVTRLDGKIAIHGNTKFASNVIHLLKEGIDLMRNGRLVFPLPYAQEILDIKQGKYELGQIQEWADRLVEEARRAFEETTLPAHPRIEEIEALVMSRVRAWQDRSLG